MDEKEADVCSVHASEDKLALLASSDDWEGSASYERGPTGETAR